MRHVSLFSSDMAIAYRIGSDGWIAEEKPNEMGFLSKQASLAREQWAVNRQTTSTGNAKQFARLGMK
jgi:hypothetical protein